MGAPFSVFMYGIILGKAFISGTQRRYLKCSIRGTSNQLPNTFYKFVHLQLFNMKHKLFIFKLFDVKFLFCENHVFPKQRRTTVYGLMDGRPQFGILNSARKMMTCYPRDINKFLRQGLLCKSILKYRFPTKGIELTRFVLFEVLGIPHL